MDNYQGKCADFLMLQKHAIEQLTAMMTIDALGYTVRPDLSYYYYHDHGYFLNAS